ncbi:Na+/H+ antiporter NhaC [Shouchella patagoniensis]|uniref:Na+/H+ antiporter NhaC n=1 Tax=Shouchella patagoniensis TaxID=228576 RepID=UPI0009956DEB|nr:Na+/H+ antiporter NhaC [Shouchella patagoniensis]
MKKIHSLMAILYFIVFILIMVGGMFIIQAPPHMLILIALTVTIIWGRFLGITYSDLETAAINGVRAGVQPILILMLVGVVIAVWMMSGTVPTLLFYGVQLLSPEWFAISALTVCIVVSTFTGSSFTTIGTVGVALMGIGIALDVPAPLVAGAIVSGACFGDKMSPLSDTTNFAPAVAGVNLFTHIRHLMWTTIPALTLTYLLFLFIGRGEASGHSDIPAVLSALDSSFVISWLALTPPVIVVILVKLRFPVLPVLVAGIVAGILVSFFVQGQQSLSTIFNALQSGLDVSTGSEMVDEIIQTGGLESMMFAVSLIIFALALGGVVQKIGVIEALFVNAERILLKRGHLIASTAAASIGVNVTTGEQYLSILLPGQFFKQHYKKAGEPMKNLSRTLEDAGTLVNPLIPWGVSGAFYAESLGVSVVEYAPYAFFLFLSPILTIIFGYAGIGVASLDKKKRNSV